MLNPDLHTDLFGHMQWVLSQPWIFGLYALGLSLSVFHLANGLWGMALVWGLATSIQAQRRIGYACAGIGLLLAALGFHGLIGFLP
jgi:succinate dehydrogenase / fumarate reductase cytochrome b subunit